jgi:ABC-type oligopeptide transport system ATPase subunit
VSDAKREHVPLLVGLMGPSGGGKTYTALRLATGIQSVSGGDIYFIDTESRRGLHYADKFKFKHVPFEAPFGSLDYLAALQFCVAGRGRRDRRQHEPRARRPGRHDRPSGPDRRPAWPATTSPSARRADARMVGAEAEAAGADQRHPAAQRQLHLLLPGEEHAKPGKDENAASNAVIAQGFMPIAGEEFVFEQTMNALLLPGAGGVPTWDSDMIGERTMIKLPEQFAGLRQRNAPLDEKVGERLAKWAGPADQQRGEQHNATSTDEQTATSLIAQIADEKTSDALDSLMARTREQVDALPDDLQETVRSAYYARFEKLSK